MRSATNGSSSVRHLVANTKRQNMYRRSKYSTKLTEFAGHKNEFTGWLEQAVGQKAGS
jgi:hypothetical protein